MKTYKEHSDLEILAKFIAKTYLPKQDRPVTAKQIAQEISDRLSTFNKKFGTSFKKISDINIRSAINIARTEDFYTGKEIIAGPSGYYLSEDLDDILKQIESLEGRIASMNSAIKGLKVRSSLYKRSIKSAKVEYNRRPLEGDLFDNL